MEGIIINKVSNTGLENIPLTLRWIKPTCWLCPKNIIDRKSSNELGRFSFNNFIDTSYFSKGYHLSISIPGNKDYIILPYDKYISVYSLEEISLENLMFEFYPKAHLQIQIERVQNDTFETFIVEHRFKEHFGYVDCVISKNNDDQYSYPLNDLFDRETASDIKTYIKWTKSSKSGRTISIDSLICKKNQTNKFIIKY